MLGSIQKYRPARKPQPYNQDTIRQLQGIGSPNQQKDGPQARKNRRRGQFPDDSLFG